MSRLEEIKNEYAKEYDYENWDSFVNGLSNYDVISHMDDISRRYAKECSQASLDKASGNVEIFDDPGYCFEYVTPKSITNPENIVLL